jgi:hypothetical protein
MGRRLPTIAKWINANMADQGYEAKIEGGYCNTDRPAGRLRIPGKGRTGNKLVVTRYGTKVLDHNSAETYRHNSEVEYWLKGELEMLARPDSERQWSVSWYDTNPETGRGGQEFAWVHAPTHEDAIRQAKAKSRVRFDSVKAREQRDHEIRDHERYL